MNSVGPYERQYSSVITGKIAALPLLPAVVAQLLVLNPDDDDFLDQVYRLARQDPTFSVRLVQYAAKTCRVTHMAEKFSLKYAIARLGSRQIASIVASLSLMDSFAPKNQSDLNLWIHSVEVAVIARRLVEAMPDLHLDGEITYLGALLHDIGRFVIFQAIPEGPERIDERHWITLPALLEAETKICGVNHVQVGAEACKRWEIPTAMSDIVANHHNYHLPIESLEERLLCARVSVIQIADYYSVYLMSHTDSVPAGDEAVDEQEIGLEQWLIEELTERLDPIILCNGSVLPEKYRAIIPKILIHQRDRTVSETNRILDALGLEEARQNKPNPDS